MKKVNLWISQQYILWPNMMSFKGYITYMISWGGVIHSWTYLYRNESPSLVAIFVIALFCLLLKEIPEHIWIVNVYLFAYDNMCNLANMRSFPNLWKDNLIEIIDSLHLNNHKRSRCRLQKSWIMHLFHDSLHIFINCHQIGQVSLKLSQYI